MGFQCDFFTHKNPKHITTRTHVSQKTPAWSINLNIISYILFNLKPLLRDCLHKTSIYRAETIFSHMIQWGKWYNARRKLPFDSTHKIIPSDSSNKSIHCKNNTKIRGGDLVRFHINQMQGSANLLAKKRKENSK